MQSLSKYFYNSWIQACGEGWTRNQVFASYVFSILFAGSVILYSYVAGLGWSGIQIFAAAWMAWDLGGGLIGYSHKAIKRKTKAYFRICSKRIRWTHQFQNGPGA